MYKGKRENIQVRQRAEGEKEVRKMGLHREKIVS